MKSPYYYTNFNFPGPSLSRSFNYLEIRKSSHYVYNTEKLEKGRISWKWIRVCPVGLHSYTGPTYRLNGSR